MKKRKYLCLCISIILLWIKGCTTKKSLENITSNLTVEVKENESAKIQESVFKEKEKMTSKTSSKKIITKTEKLCEELEEVETDIETYNVVNHLWMIKKERKKI